MKACGDCGRLEKHAYQYFICDTCSPRRKPKGVRRAAKAKLERAKNVSSKAMIPDYLRPYQTAHYRMVARAKKKGWECDISLAELATYRAMSCEYCGDPSTGLDRVDSSIGYVHTNVVPACWGCNMMKRTLTVDEFYNKCQQILDYRPN